MAIHAGDAELRHDDYFGPSLNRVARVLAIGHGGQVLVSAAAAALVADDLPAGAALFDRGEHHLRDLTRSEHVYQLTAPGLTTDFPALRSGAAPTNLPADLTTFIGRSREAAEIRGILATHRFATLVGVGGTGKTRLMLHVAGRAVGPTRRRGVAGRARSAARARARRLRGRPGAGCPGLARRSRRSSRVTDFLREQGPAPAARQLRAPDRGGSRPRRASSCELPHRAGAGDKPRSARASPGEATYPVPSLALPETMDQLDLEAIAATEAVSLFVERATTTLPSFRLDASNAASVVEICRRLDGIPLALELAAARVNVLSAAEIAQGLGDRFRLLTGGRRTAVPRQQTLQALIDWSWDLLTEADQRLLGRLSVFTGGWTLDAAAGRGRRPGRSGGGAVRRSPSRNARRPGPPRRSLPSRRDPRRDHPLRDARDDPPVRERPAGRQRRRGRPADPAPRLVPAPGGRRVDRHRRPRHGDLAGPGRSRPRQPADRAGLGLRDRRANSAPRCTSASAPTGDCAASARRASTGWPRRSTSFGAGDRSRRTCPRPSGPSSLRG